MERKVYIYSLEYPEGNVRYIGKTIDLKRRYVNHLYSAKEEKNKKEKLDFFFKEERFKTYNECYRYCS